MSPQAPTHRQESIFPGFRFLAHSLHLAGSGSLPVRRRCGFGLCFRGHAAEEVADGRARYGSAFPGEHSLCCLHHQSRCQTGRVYFGRV